MSRTCFVCDKDLGMSIRTHSVLDIISSDRRVPEGMLYKDRICHQCYGSTEKLSNDESKEQEKKIPKKKDVGHYSWAQATASCSQQEAFEITKSICDELQAKIIEVNDEMQILRGDATGERFLILIADAKPGTSFEVYYDRTSVKGPVKEFINPFFEILERKVDMPLRVEPKIVEVKQPARETIIAKVKSRQEQDYEESQEDTIE